MSDGVVLGVMLCLIVGGVSIAVTFALMQMRVDDAGATNEQLGNIITTQQHQIAALVAYIRDHSEGDDEATERELYGE